MNLQSIQQMDNVTLAIVKNDKDSGTFMATAKDFDLEITFHEVETYGEVMRLTENKMVDAGIVNRLYIKPIRIPSIFRKPLWCLILRRLDMVF